MPTTAPSLSIVIPCHNEENVIESTCERLIQLIEQWPSQIISNFELVLVNNGSTDQTLEVMLLLQKTYKNIKIVDLVKNYGYQGSITAGLHHAKNEMIVTIDADLQDDPIKIIDMVQKYKEGYGLVIGIRSNRNTDSFLKKNTAQIYYKLLEKLGVHSVYNHGEFRLMSRRLVNDFKNLKERNRYIRSLIFELESKYACVFYERSERQTGVTKFKLTQLIGLSLDGITSFSIVPIRFVTFLGISMMGLAITGIGIVLYIKYIALVNVPGWASLVTLFFLFGGIQCFSIGIIGEYIAKIYIEVKARPVFSVRRLYSTEKDEE